MCPPQVVNICVRSPTRRLILSLSASIDHLQFIIQGSDHRKSLLPTLAWHVSWYCYYDGLIQTSKLFIFMASASLSDIEHIILQQTTCVLLLLLLLLQLLLLSAIFFKLTYLQCSCGNWILQSTQFIKQILSPGACSTSYKLYIISYKSNHSCLLLLCKPHTS